MTEFAKLEAVRLDEEKGALVLLDQTRLPTETVFLNLRDQEDIWQAIYSLQVRGAPAIGIAAGYACYLAAKYSPADSAGGLERDFIAARDHLATSRPTAVNLFWALERMTKTLEANRDEPVAAIRHALLAESHAIKDEDIRMCRAIGEHGLGLVKPGMGILTHCNAGQLAASRYGTALAPIYVAHEKGYNLKVFADETRPLLQGARLTAFELQAAGVDVTLICDDVAASVMKRGWVQAVFVGCDRAARNGDFANKIGTLGVAIMAKRYNIPFYVCLPHSTIDMRAPSGDSIEIEERNPKEVTDMWYEKPMAPENVKGYNPAFDVTDHELVTAIITERGIARAPYEESFRNMGLA
ncbi:MAG: S-methyl-5-thioribose-1-phosphate isomerase [Planctomycetota bacterium]|jgi:methylthioribose-1-phosphate isomerase|nr:S-methyl-5-thioribose-1-phosphate isomerase [Planctomycetota bacterium]